MKLARFRIRIEGDAWVVTDGSEVSDHLRRRNEQWVLTHSGRSDEEYFRLSTRSLTHVERYMTGQMGVNVRAMRRLPRIAADWGFVSDDGIEHIAPDWSLRPAENGVELHRDGADPVVFDDGFDGSASPGSPTPRWSTCGRPTSTRRACPCSPVAF
jgi:hypothetical protein